MDAGETEKRPAERGNAKATAKAESPASPTIHVQERKQDAATDLPMDHGLTAWLQVLACWILFANTWSV